MKTESIAALVCAAAALTFAPITFGEDGYLESEGDARICLVHFIGPNTKMEVDFQLTTAVDIEFNRLKTIIMSLSLVITRILQNII